MLESDGLRVEAAYGLLQPTLVRRLTFLTRDREIGEDIAQEAFVRLIREVDAGRTPDDVAAWLYRVSTNLVASRGRHLTVVDRKAAAIRPPSASPDPETEAVRAETTATLRTVLDALPATDRQALLLAASGYAGPEIAHRIDRSPGATRTLLCRARGKMRQRLTAVGYAPA